MGNPAEKKQKILIIGGGQVGGSMLLGLAQENRFDLNVYDRNEETADYWRNSDEGKSGKVTVVGDPAAAARDADIIILATPISAFGDITAALAPHLKPGAIISDVGSAKEKSIERIRDALKNSGRDRDVFYIPAHPGTGTDGQGPQTARADMYRNKPFFIVPPAAGASAGEQAASETQKNLYKNLTGGDLTEIDAASHDSFFGTTSHLQHAAVFALTACGADNGVVDENYLHAGSILRNTTRIANGVSSSMWIPVFEDNRKAVLESAERLKKYLAEIRGAIAQGDRPELLSLLKAAHEYRLSMKNDVRRESIWSEFADIGEEDISADKPAVSLSQIFQKESVSRFTSRVNLPTVLAAAITLNIKETDSSFVKGISIAERINPSALDGTAPMLADPDVLSYMLLNESGKKDLLRSLDRYIDKFDEVTDAIRNDDKAYLDSLIQTASSIRSQMPPPRRGETARVDFVHEIS